MRTRKLLFIVAALAGVFFHVSILKAGTADLRFAQDDFTVSILDGNQPVLRYRYRGVPKKPYADQLFSPAGVQVLRDSPHDHKHHHGLMFAVAVDGVNFWEEHTASSGKELHKGLGELKAAVQQGEGRAEFAQNLEWIGPKSDRPLLVERRRLEVLKGPDLGATLVEWRSLLETPPGKESIELSGHPYFGLGMRFVESMDRGGRFFYADDRSSKVIEGSRRHTPTKWCAYTAKADGKPVTVALFDHPDYLHHPAMMYTMTEPFAYLSATVNGWKAPVIVKAGKPLKLRYGVALWDGEVDKATVERLYQRWLKLSTMKMN